MKSPFLISVLSVLLLAGCSPKPRYEFKVVGDGVAVYRFDLQTGRIDLLNTKDRVWIAFPDPPDKFVPPPLSSLEK